MRGPSSDRVRRFSSLRGSKTYGQERPSSSCFLGSKPFHCGWTSGVSYRSKTGPLNTLAIFSKKKLEIQRCDCPKSPESRLGNLDLKSRYWKSALCEAWQLRGRTGRSSVRL